MLNDDYEALAEHYMTAVMPTGVRKPKHKPSVEGTVGSLTTWVTARLRDARFYRLADLNARVRELVAEYNARPFQKREGSRLEAWEGFERAALRPLPDTPYDVAEWAYNRSVGLNSHVAWGRNYYSAPSRLVGSKVDLRVGESTLEIWSGGERVATHALMPAWCRNCYSTDESHMPDRAKRPEWDAARIRGWARKVGPSCAAAVERMFSTVRVEEQAFNPALALLRLTQRYGDERVESACAHALTKFASPRYRHVKAIIDGNVGGGAAPSGDGRPAGRVRGAGYYS